MRRRDLSGNPAAAPLIADLLRVQEVIRTSAAVEADAHARRLEIIEELHAMGMSYESTARLLEISPEAVLASVRRARERASA